MLKNVSKALLFLCRLNLDSYANNYFADRSFTNLDKYEYIENAKTAAQLGKI